MSAALDEEVVRIQAAIDVVDDLVGLPEEAFAAAFFALRDLSGARAEAIAGQLAIVLNRHRDALGAQLAAFVTAQLTVLIGALLRNTDSLRAMLRAHGIDAEDAVRSAAEFLSTAPARKPVAKDASSASNVFNSLIRSKLPKR
jgi:hypothetical protein